MQIESIAEEDVGDGAQAGRKVRGQGKGLGPERHKPGGIEAAFGPDSDDAIGGQVIAFVDPDVRYGGQKVGGIRIKLPKKANAKEKAAPKESTAEYLNDDLPRLVEPTRPGRDTTRLGRFRKDQPTWTIAQGRRILAMKM